MARFSLDLSYLIETVRFVPLLFEGCLGHSTDTDTPLKYKRLIWIYWQTANRHPKTISTLSFCHNAFNSNNLHLICKMATNHGCTLIVCFINSFLFHNATIVLLLTFLVLCLSSGINSFHVNQTLTLLRSIFANLVCAWDLQSRYKKTGELI